VGPSHLHRFGRSNGAREEEPGRGKPQGEAEALGGALEAWGLQGPLMVHNCVRRFLSVERFFWWDMQICLLASVLCAGIVRIEC